MSDVLSVALSGLMAQGRRMAASASNIANVNTVGRLPTAESPASTVYKPLSVSYTALTAGGSGAGVAASVTENSKAYTAVFDPSSPYADSQGLIAAPNIDLDREIVNVTETKLVYKANVAVIKTQDKMLHDLLNTIV